MKRRRPMLALAPLLLVALAACGTTLDDSDFTAQPGRGSVLSADGSSVAGGDGSGADAGTTLDAGTGSSDPAGAAGSSTSGAGTSGGGSTGSTATGSGTTATSPGAKAPTSAAAVPLQAAPTAVDPSLDPVEVGVLYFGDANSAGSLTGGANQDFGDPKSQTTATLAFINAHGGFAGHKVVPVFSNIAVTDTTPYATTEQKVCDLWTQDHHVVAGIVVGNIPPALQSCMNDRKAVVYDTGNYQHDLQDYKSWPFMVNGSELVADLQQTALVESLVRQGFFKPGDKIGVFTEDYPAAKRAYTNALLPALKKHGLTVTDSFAAHFPESTGELAGALASLQTPSLRFKSEGITKVLFTATGEMGTVMQAADSQGFRPAYGFTSNEGPVSREANSVAHTQLVGSMGIGWNPFLDITQNGSAPNSTAQQCLDIMKPISGANSPTAQLAAYHYCGSLLMLAAGAAQNRQTTFTGDALRVGMGRLGSSFSSPLNDQGTTITDSHRWGVTTGRDFAYDTSCFCLKYTSGPIAIG